ncbi:MAG TPA: PspC domain-containing protein [Candidatus Saccharimonadales bacterium]|nr:PspC domain-containing protein [Candidatus Saccharimonadales bacterium]
MNEITRIHIAKIPYDIEINAKKDLEKYLKTLESYSDDTEIIDDIEIRITEILLDRGVKKGDVISNADVETLRQQLGEPSEFMGEQTTSIEVSGTKRKLFRNVDNSIVGGVLGGIAAFFNVNPLWIRLAFIALALASFGTALLVYVVLWIVVPPAKTAADKLQMKGHAVTIASIREFNENEMMNLPKQTGVSGKHVVTTVLAVGSVLLALGSIVVTVGATIAAFIHRQEGPFASDESGFYVAAFILAVCCGLLFTILCIIIAYAAFSQKITRRAAVLLGVVIILGLTSFGTAIGLVQYGRLRHEATVQSNTHDMAISLPNGSQSMTGIDINIKDIKVNYIATSGVSSASLRVVTDDDHSTPPKVTATLDNKVLVLHADTSSEECMSVWCRDTQPVLTIKGPALDNIHARQDALVSYATSEQEGVAIVADTTSRVTLDAGVIKQVTLTAAEESVINTQNATITSIAMNISSTADLDAGTISTLSVVNQDACPKRSESMLAIERISSGTMTVNGKSMKAESTRLACMTITINNEEEIR